VRQLATLLAVLAVAGCTTPRGGYYADDGPGANPPDVSRTPDAVPRSDPLSETGNKPYTVNGKSYVPVRNANGYRERGVASWYGRKFHGRRTSSGEPYDMYAMTAAHKTLPLPSYVRVRNLQNGKSVVVRVNDRGPFLHNRLIDLSYAAAARLDIAAHGTGLVEIEAVGAEPATPVARKPVLEIIPAAQAASSPAPVMYLQVGAFALWDNAAALRTRLERAEFKPVRIQSAAPGENGNSATATLHRVRIGPLASVEEGDRLTQQLARAGIPDALIVVE
jgi:rare lipoprotein A